MNLKAFGGQLYAYAAFKEEGNAKQIGLLVCQSAANGCGKRRTGSSTAFTRGIVRNDGG
jgi:hypothetical protein